MDLDLVSGAKSATPGLHEQDFVLWLEQQARALRDAAGAGTNLPIDWEQLAGEVESLGNSERDQLRSRIFTILVHLMKLEASRANYPRAGWRDTVQVQRGALARGVLRRSPSLRRAVAVILDEELSDAARSAANRLEAHGELTDAARERLARARYSEEQVLGDWLPDEPA